MESDFCEWMDSATGRDSSKCSISGRKHESNLSRLSFTQTMDSVAGAIPSLQTFATQTLYGIDDCVSIRGWLCNSADCGDA
jgi:hypothetical protein